MIGKKQKYSYYTHLRRQHHNNQKNKIITPITENHIWLYGFHTVKAVLDNPQRKLHRLLITKNACNRLGLNKPGLLPYPVEVTEPKTLDRLLGSETVHQGIMIETEPLPLGNLENFRDTCSLLTVLDQVTDPQNVGSIMRSSAAFNVSALITTARHSPQESGVLAKAASGALELVNYIAVRNMAETLEKLHEAGFQTVALDAKGIQPLETTFSGHKIALVFGAEGKGLRKRTRETVSMLARLDTPGMIQSLNVSNAAAIALYTAHSYLNSQSLEDSKNSLLSC
ncbi:MAG: 23S rRNA (guanosine2251-2'-O)-methyltransferase [Candidatus Tokpelaia sp. JSC085]|nr:MAG: 23S rRNA (guanosine2251-2'-O)-methyltransferase [Candidatus Tokpelaia sp. JSC085]